MAEDGGRASIVDDLAEKVEKLTRSMEKMKLSEYVKLLDRPWHLLYLNFIAGIARGFGMAIGFTLLGALVVYALQRSFFVNMPVIGRVLAELVRIVQRQLNR
ncbi:MAG: DUF5665 domain-containing protein [Chloroflexota bacterium]